ncbi:MAG TPA: M64 family metallopeptidase, partial [bacterium]|nr:M64 family metallopeptidase [bacterium]
FTQEPWNEYQSYVNVYAIEVISNESGADHPSLGIYKDTALGATYDFGGVRRALFCTETQSVFNVANRIPGWDAVYIVVNDTEYGGTGGYYSTFSVHPDGPDVAVHENAHTFAGLADEYEGDMGGGKDSEPNIENATTLEAIKWKMWILPDTPIPTPDESLYDGLVGLFEGAKYQMTGLYRPKRNCKMRELGVAFCEVCTETHLVGSYARSIYKILDIIEGTTPSEQDFEVTLGGTSSLLFSLDTLQNESQTVKARWYLDGVEQLGVSDTQISISGSQLSQGDHWVYVIVRDRTDMIRNDPFNYRREEYYWTFKVNLVSSVAPQIWNSY